jgi:hypothetical protein
MAQTTTPAAAVAMLDAMERHIAQRSGMDFRNYWTSDHWNAHTDARAAFMRDYRPMLRAGKDARAMLRILRAAAEWDGDTVARNLSTGQRAFAGRLTYDAARGEWEYTTGQYFPTEYRAAACAVLASALRDRGYDYADAVSALGRAIARRWFK